MDININENDDLVSVKFEGDIDMMGIKDLKDTLYKLSDENDKNIEINLSSATYLDSSAIGMLLSLNKKQKGKGKEIRLIDVPENIKKILELSSLNSIL